MLLDHLFALAPIRQTLWQLWYPYLTRRLRTHAVLFLNYAFETTPPLAIPLSPHDEPDRPCIQLYHHVATQVDLRGKNILEISCGHGGGASYLTRTLHPQHYTALDLNPAGIRFCRQHHQLPNLEFIQGHAQNLPFAPNTFDAVINIEASHCYPSLPRFLAQVARVLKPGGHFLYADFRFSDRLPEWNQALTTAPLRILHTRNINAEVRRGMDLNARRSLDLIQRHLPRFLHPIGRDFAGLPGSRIYNALIQNELSYRSYCMEKSPT